MSLAMSAAPFDTNDNQHENQNQNYNSYNNDTPIHKKRTSHNKTQKHSSSSIHDFNQDKVNSVLASIHNGTHDDDNVDNYNPKGRAPAVHEFKPLNPIQPPESMRQEGMQNNPDSDGLVPKPVEQEDLNLQNLDSNFMNDAQVRDYYRKLVPNYNTNNNNNNNNTNNNNTNNKQYTSNNVDNQTLVEKLNYMINLLEEQQDQKTNNVTEEVVLYSFLGIFIIFVVDSFARVGKYVR
jgi:anti-sigma28 factor (negative regulator of flagellin synthesis)